MSKMTIQKAAAQLLREFNQPMLAKEISRIALERELVESGSVNKVQSLTQTLERNIRLNMGNRPRLIFVETDAGRCVDLPERHEDQQDTQLVNDKDIIKQAAEGYQSYQIDIPLNMVKLLKIHQLMEEYPTIEETIIELISVGLSSSTGNLIEKLKNS